MPLVQVSLLEGRPPERLEALIAAVTDAVVDTLDAPRESVRVLVTEIPADRWGVGGRPISQLRAGLQPDP